MSNDDHSKPILVGRIGKAPDARLSAPSALRNREPILQVLKRLLPPTGSVLEIGSGSGEHVIHFARELPSLSWQPSDPDPAARQSILAWTRTAPSPNIKAPLDIDVCADYWDAECNGPFDVIVSINMVHIAPWEATLGLFAGADRLLRPRDILFLYGPFMKDGRHTAPSNAQFDASLKAQNPKWGLRDIDDLARVGEMHRLALRETITMPANNFSLVFGRSSPPKRRQPKVKVEHHIAQESRPSGNPLPLSGPPSRRS